MANNNQMMTNTVHILTLRWGGGVVLFHSLYADDNKQTNRQVDVNYTEYIQNETLKLSFDNIGNTSCEEPNSSPESELPL